MTIPVPKHYWKFDEASGTIARDSVGGATISLDRASWVAGRSGSAVRFDFDDGVRLATTNLPEMPAPWTATFWVYRWSDSGSTSLFSSLDHALKLQQWETPEQVGITTFGYKDWSFGVELPLGEWTHLALVGTGTETKLYLNGVLKGTLPVSIPLGLYWLGSTQGYEEFAKALLDEVKVWDVALTDEQVGGLANLDLDLTTGKAAWRLVSAPPDSGLTVGPAPVVEPYSLWTATLPNAKWLGKNVTAAAGEYIFELSFSLSAAVSNPEGEIQVRADQYATIWLNDTKIGDLESGIAWWLAETKATVVQLAQYANLLRPEGNRLQVKVINPQLPSYVENPAGLLLSGWLKAGGG